MEYTSKELQDKTMKEWINKLKNLILETNDNNITTLMEEIEVFEYNTLKDDLTRAKMKYDELKLLYETSPTEDLFLQILYFKDNIIPDLNNKLKISKNSIKTYL
jgi:hypothetical protein